MKTSILHLSLAALVLVCATADAVPPTGGTSPGGFELNSGTGSLRLWFQADQISGLTNGQTVGTWNNSALTTSAGTNATAVSTPSFQNVGADLINGNPIVRFDGSTDYFNGSVTVGGPKTFFSVVEDTGTTGTCCSGGISTRTTGSSNFNGLQSVLNGGTQKFFADRSSAGLVGNASILNAATIGSLTYETTGTSIFVNGSLDASNATNYQYTGTSYQIGTRNNQSGRYFRGDMAESAVFNRVLNTPERVLVENYLSSKYDVALSANDLYSGDSAGNGDYDRNVFGIANIAGTSSASGGSAGFGFEATAGLDPGDSMLAGHATETNIELDNQWERTWYVDVMNFDGDELLDLAFDWSDSGLGAPNEDFLDLLFSPTDGGPFAAIETGVLTGDTVNFTGVSGSSLASGYYTLGQQQQVPEPASIAIWTLLGLALSAFGYYRARRNK